MKGCKEKARIWYESPYEYNCDNQ